MEDLKDRAIRFAGVLWLAAGISYLTSEAIAAAAFPGYSYATNYISDLGVPYVGTSGGRAVNSPLAAVMNVGGFTLDGILFASASIAASRAAGKAKRRVLVFLLLAIVHSAGSILVGSVHSGDREVAAGVHHFHVIGAAMAIVGGNLALIAASRIAPRLGAPPVYAIASLGLGIFGLLALAMLEIGAIAGRHILPDGIFERCSVYPITTWEIITGLNILVAGRRRAVGKP